MTSASVLAFNQSSADQFIQQYSNSSRWRVICFCSGFRESLVRRCAPVSSSGCPVKILWEERVIVYKPTSAPTRPSKTLILALRWWMKGVAKRQPYNNQTKISTWPAKLSARSASRCRVVHGGSRSPHQRRRPGVFTIGLLFDVSSDLTCK